MSLAAIITQMATIEAAITGIKHAYDNPDEAINEPPCFVNVPDGPPVVLRSPGSVRQTTHRIKALCLVVRGGSITTADKELRPYLEATFSAFDAKITLNGACAHSRIVSAKYGEISWGGQPYLGWSFELEVMERNIVTMA